MLSYFLVCVLGISALCLVNVSFAFSNNINQNLRNNNPFPYKISNWKRIVTDDLFYIDKTDVIIKLETKGKFIQLCRPNGYGKTLFCQQLAMYYDKALSKKEFAEYFGNTYVGIKSTVNKCGYLILYFTFSDINMKNNDNDDKNNILKSFRNYINYTLQEFIKKYDIQNAEIDAYDHLQSLRNVLDVLHYRDLFQSISDKIYLIIDDYDSLTNRIFYDDDDDDLKASTSSSNIDDYGLYRYKKKMKDCQFLLEGFNDVISNYQGIYFNVFERIFITTITPCIPLLSLNMKDISSPNDDSFDMTFGLTSEEVKEGLNVLREILIFNNTSDTNNDNITNGIIITDQQNKQSSVGSVKKSFELPFLKEHVDVIHTNFGGYRNKKNLKESLINIQQYVYYVSKLFFLFSSSTSSSSSSSSSSFLMDNNRPKTLQLQLLIDSDRNLYKQTECIINKMRVFDTPEQEGIEGQQPQQQQLQQQQTQQRIAREIALLTFISGGFESKSGWSLTEFKPQDLVSISNNVANKAIILSAYYHGYLTLDDSDESLVTTNIAFKAMFFHHIISSLSYDSRLELQVKYGLVYDSSTGQLELQNKKKSSISGNGNDNDTSTTKIAEVSEISIINEAADIIRQYLKSKTINST